jgi:hypothetical protein
VTENYNAAVPSLGVQLEYSTTSGGTYTPVGQLKSLDEPEEEMGQWESTGLTSAAKEYLPTLIDGGEVSGHVIWNPADMTHIALVGYFQAGTILYWKIVYPEQVGPGLASPASYHIPFVGFLIGFTTGPSEVEAYHEAVFKIKITGLPGVPVTP